MATEWNGEYIHRAEHGKKSEQVNYRIYPLIIESINR